MKSNKKDPYNFEKIDGFIREYNNKTNDKKPMNGKIYQKSRNINGEIKNEGRE